MFISVRPSYQSKGAIRFVGIAEMFVIHFTSIITTPLYYVPHPQSIIIISPRPVAFEKRTQHTVIKLHSPHTGCSITDNPGQLISIYNVPTSGGPDVIETYHIENAIVIDNGNNNNNRTITVVMNVSKTVLTYSVF